MKRSIKKVLSVILAMAMIVTSMSYTPKEVSADDYSGLTYTDIANNQNNEFNQLLRGAEYAVVGGGTLGSCQFQNAGFGELYITGSWSADNLAAKVNDVEDSVTIEGTGLRIYNAANYLTQEYNEIDVTWGGR